MISLQLAVDPSKTKAVDLAERFVRLVGRAELRASTELDELLNEVLGGARSAWPTIAVSDEDIIHYLAERLGPSEDVKVFLSTVHTSDLYLACACCRRDAKAIAAFERHYVSQLGAYLARSDGSLHFTEELRQTLRERVLVGQEGVPARICSYNGRGPLGAWLRMVSARIAVDLRRRQKNEPLRNESPEVPSTSLDPELGYLKERYRLEFEEALEGAFRDLSSREGALIRLHFLDGMALSSMAPMYGVSTRTVQRWIAAAEAKITAGMRRRLAAKLALSDKEIESLLGLVMSQLNVSLRRFLKTNGE